MEYTEITKNQAIGFIRKQGYLEVADEMDLRPSVTVSLPEGKDKNTVLNQLFADAGVDRS